MAKVIVFDVNETLLDMGVLRPHFERVYGTTALMNEWFARLLHASLVVSLTDSYYGFGNLAAAELDLLAARQEVNLSSEDRQVILDTMANLPPHPEVFVSLGRLRSSGFRLATLTNSPAPLLLSQMTNAGLKVYFDVLLSVDQVRLFKPAPEPYLMAAERLEVPIDQIWLVAAHDWDVHGAIQAGCSGAFIARPGKTYHPLYKQPHISGSDLGKLTDKIMEREK